MTARDRAILRAVQVGRAELVCGCEQHLLVDGLHVCDQDTHALAGMRVLAVLTDAGQQALANAEVTACAGGRLGCRLPVSPCRRCKAAPTRRSEPPAGA